MYEELYSYVNELVVAIICERDEAGRSIRHHVVVSGGKNLPIWLPDFFTNFAGSNGHFVVI